MKKIYIPLKSNLNKNLDENKIIENSKKIPEELLIAYSAQNKIIAEKLAKILRKNKKIAGTIQVLGCSNPEIKKQVQAVVLLSTGKFHSVSLTYETGKEVYVFSENDFIKVSNSEIEKLKTIQKASYINYLNSEKIGVLVSTKHGQNRSRQASGFSKKVTGKKVYLFLGDNLQTDEFENFPQIGSWVNTACPRIDLESPRVINIREILENKTRLNFCN